ncbi:MAG: pantetheine-phosphate adenylyltransferase [Gemmatimonadota bacterium]
MAPRERLAIYPGSFDPPTLGHDDLVQRSLKLVDRLILGVAETATHEKHPLFPVEERVDLMRELYGAEGAVEVVPFAGLLVDFAREQGAGLIIRGLRAVSDFEYEFQMALMNRSLWPQVEIIFMAPDSKYTFLSSSLVREVARLGGDVSRFVPGPVLERMAERYGESVRGA